MPFYVVRALDGPGKSEARAQARPQHRARLREHDFDLKVHVGGPLLNDDSDMCGTVLIVEAQDKHTVAQFVDGDPYSIAGVYGSVEINEFNWGLGQPEVPNG